MINISCDNNYAVLASMLMKSMVSYEPRKVPFSFIMKAARDRNFIKVRKQLLRCFKEHNFDYMTVFGFLRPVKCAVIYDYALHLTPDGHFKPKSDAELPTAEAYEPLAPLSEALDSLFYKCDFAKQLDSLLPCIDTLSKKNTELLKTHLPVLLKALHIDAPLNIILNTIPINLQSGDYNVEHNSICFGCYEFYFKYMEHEILLHEACLAVVNTFIRDITSEAVILSPEVYENKGYTDIHAFQAEVLARIFTLFIMQRENLGDYKRALKFHEYMGFLKLSDAFSAFDLIVRRKDEAVLCDRNQLVEHLTIYK